MPEYKLSHWSVLISPKIISSDILTDSKDISVDELRNPSNCFLAIPSEFASIKTIDTASLFFSDLTAHRI